MIIIEIKKELVLRAPKTVVWDAITTREGWNGWFSDDILGEFRVGETVQLDFGKHGVCEALVVERVEGESLAIQWHPGEDCNLDKYPRDQMTTIRFELSDHPEGTMFVMSERGFEKIPEERRSKCIELNTEGWDYELEELAAWIESGVRQSKSSS